RSRRARYHTRRQSPVRRGGGSEQPCEAGGRIWRNGNSQRQVCRLHPRRTLRYFGANVPAVLRRLAAEKRPRAARRRSIRGISQLADELQARRPADTYSRTLARLATATIARWQGARLQPSRGISPTQPSDALRA